MMRAGVGGGEGSELTERADGRGAGTRGRGWFAAERSVSSGEEDVRGTTRMRPLKLIV